MIQRIKESSLMAVEACDYLLELLEKTEYEEFIVVINDLHELLISMNSSIENENILKERFKQVTALYIPNAKASIVRIVQLLRSRSNNLSMKMEFELKPIIEDMYLETIYNSDYYGSAQSELAFLKDYGNSVFGNKYIDKAHESSSYKYEVSIIVLAYNKIEYTQNCISQILKYTPVDLNYELILINNGSTDNTKTFFEGVSPTKQIDLEINGMCRFIYRKIVEGKYILFVSNDVLVTKSYLENLLKSDTSIVKVVPTTPNVSNLQFIPANFDDAEGMATFAERNNVSSKYRWEQRVRLVDPLSLQRSYEFCSSVGYSEGTRIFMNHKAFPDDAAAAMMRRAGQKMMLAKDCYCFHYGSVTYNETNSENCFLEGRKQFENIFGIDPWGKGFCYDEIIVESIPLIDSESINVLGMNTGLGANPLKIKQLFKEVKHNEKVFVYNVTDESKYIQDLQGVSDKAELVDDVYACELGGIKGNIDYLLNEYTIFTIDQLKKAVEFAELVTKDKHIIILTCTKDMKQHSSIEQYQLIDNSIDKQLCWIVIDKTNIIDKG